MVGPYEVISLLGSGGMGEVFRARDTKLNRDVALKVLPEAFTLDADRLARFKREAQVLASLNHPNIGAIYGLEESNGVLALVLELVAGPTVADRLTQGPFPFDEAVSVGKQIASALEAAHEQGIIHRDLKPANIKLRPDGKVKVLDFGLAKATEPASTSSSNVSAPPAATKLAMTKTGIILGTAPYMSPEQARGKPADRRTDIWAFGCVLYEMLSRRPVFELGDTVSDAVAAILTREPDWTALPPETPEAIRRLLRRCLQKDPERRVRDIADARLELEELANAPSELAPSMTPRRGAAARSATAVPWVVAAVAVGTAAWMAWSRSSRPAVPAQPVTRLEINLPAGVEVFTEGGRTIAVSPDGSQVAFIGAASGPRQLYLRALDQFDSVPIRGTGTATMCFFSADGRSIAFGTTGGDIKTVRLADGWVADVTGGANVQYGATWTADDRIVFVRNYALWQVPRSGGAPTQLTTLDGAGQDSFHAFPHALPDGKTVLFGAFGTNGWRIESVSLATGERRTILEQGTQPLYSISGHLAFVRDGKLLIAPFDPERLEITGPAVASIESLPVSGNAGVAILAMSASGTVVYSPTTATGRLVWVSRQGAEQPLNDTLRRYTNPRVAPRGDRVLVQAADDLWIQDVERTTFTRLTSRQLTNNAFPIWTPDGRVIHRAQLGLRVLAPDGGGEVTEIHGTTPLDYPTSVSSDGETLFFARVSDKMSFDLYSTELRGGAEPTPILQTPALESGGRISPDGHWLVYTSDDSGRFEVYLRPFQGPDRRWPVSTQGGTQAIWNPNGKEIFYRDRDKMMAVEFSTDPQVTLSPPRLLFEQHYSYASGLTIANYDVTSDGQRFLMVKDESSGTRLNVVMNWVERLQEGAPAR